MVEKRKYPRFELRIDAKYHEMDYKEVFSRIRTRNISAEGICFESDKKLRIGTHVKLEVNLKDKNPPVCLISEVRWSSEIKSQAPREKRYINGVRLIDIPRLDEARFLKYYCNKMVEKLANYSKM